jgi:lipopolysaccharide/colanic/teichoic acid biosynthesis glycosyltransferase
MNDRELTVSLSRRYDLARTSLGRFLLTMHVQQQQLRAAWRVKGPSLLKRACDFTLSALCLVLLSPLFLLITLAVLLEDGGPVFFSQTRVGKDGREFKMYKIRSMCLHAEERLEELLQQNHHHEGITFKIIDDPRITRIGKWLRKFSFDELPQLYNVLVGEMSLVGPRPPLATRGRQVFAGSSATPHD